MFQVLIQLETAPFDDKAHWYTLHHHDSQIPPPLPSPSLPRRQMKPIRNGRNNRNEPLSSPASVGCLSDSDVSDDGIGAVTGIDFATEMDK